MKGGSIIREARKRAGLTQADLAKRMGTTQSAIARWERGRSLPAFQTVVRAIRACGLDLHVSIATYDDQDDLLIEDQLGRSLEGRLDAIANLVRQERIIRGARRVG